MNIYHALEHGHSKEITTRIIKYVGRDKARFDELLKLFFGPDKKLQQRAAWPLSYLAEGNPRLIEPHLKKLILMLEKPGLHSAVARNIMRIFQLYDLPEIHHGRLIDICFKFILDPKTPIATRAFSITTAAHIARPYPELKRELLLVFSELKDQPQSPAIGSRLKNALKILQSKL